jgi:hypothetical protein
VRTPYRIANTAVAVAAIFPIGMPAAAADTASSEPASASAYFSSTTPPKDDALPQDPGPQFVGLNTDRVAPGNLAVSQAVPGQGSDKESFIRFDLLAVPPDATISSAVVTVPLQPNDANNNSANHTPDKVKACATGPEGFADGIDAGAYDEKPTVDCKRLEVVAKATTDGLAYTFDVTPLARTWLTDLNDGIALVPAKNDQPFQVVFQPGSKATIAVTYTAAQGGTIDPVIPPIVMGPPVAPPPGDVAPPVQPNIGTAPQPQPQPAPQASPAPRPKVARQQPITTVASGGGGFTESNGLTPGFWFAALAGVGLLGVISLILGNPEVPVAASSVQNGVGRALDERRRVRGGRSAVRPSVRPA